ncbi:MAG: hypothetical protein AAGF92_12130 [Myxococcota bacterium]
MFLGLVFAVACGDSSTSNTGGNAGNSGTGGFGGFDACCETEDDDRVVCCNNSGPDVNVNDGEALVVDGQINNISVNRGVVLFTQDACICGFMNLNSNGARVYVDAWDEAPPLQAAKDANVNANAYLYVQQGGLYVGNNFANNSGGATLLEGDLDVAANLYLNAAALMCTMEGSFEANPVVDNGGDRLVVGEPNLEETLDETFEGDLDDVSDDIADSLDERFPGEADGTTIRVRFSYDADTLDEAIELPMLFQSESGRWGEVGR